MHIVFIFCNVRKEALCNLLGRSRRSKASTLHKIDFLYASNVRSSFSGVIHSPLIPERNLTVNPTA